MSEYKAIIIGAGRIGAGFDTPDTPDVLTHAHAYSRHPRIRLAGIMDVDAGKAGEAAAKWDCSAYSDLEKIFSEQHPEIVSICTPDDSHYDVLLRCLEYQPAAVVVEKPLTSELVNSQEIVRLYRQRDIPLWVNFIRRFDSRMQDVKRDIEIGRLGRILHASIRYTKGILHNGSHAVDVANFLFGQFRDARVLGAVEDYDPRDPTLHAVLSYEKCPAVFLQACDERAYSIFEVDIVAEKKRLTFEQFGYFLRQSAVREDPRFAGYHDLDDGCTEKTALGESLSELINNVLGQLEAGNDLLCSGQDALGAEMICHQLLDQHFQERGSRGTS